MKLINLVFQGITGREENYDFGNKAAGCTVLQDADQSALAKALSFAFYGSVDPTNYDLPLVVNVKFMIDDIEYDLTRALVREESGAVTEKVALTDLNTAVIYGEGKEDIDAYLLSKVGLDKDAFEKLLFIDEEYTAPIGNAQVARESFVAEQIASLATSQKVLGKYNGLKEEEASVLAYVDSIEAVTRDQIKEQQLSVDNEKLSLDALRNQIEEVNLELLNADKYREELDAYNVANAKLEALQAVEADMADLAEKAAKSEQAREIADVFAKYQDTMRGLQETEASIVAQTQEVDALEAKIAQAKDSEKLLGDEFALASIRANELNAKMREIIKEGATNPSGVKIKETIESYYAETIPEIEQLSARQKELNASYDVLDKLTQDLTERKLAIREASDYKRAVQDGAVLECNVAQLESSLKECQDRIEALEKRRAELYEKNVEYVGKAKVLDPVVKKLEKEIKGEYASVQDAINNDEFYKRTIYTKHLFVSDREVELDAVEKKIEAVRKSDEGYKNQLADAKARKETVLAEKKKILDKLELLKEKLLEYSSYNRLRDISKDIEYGTRCPICDGFVAHKKDLPLRDTKALDDQIKAVQEKLAYYEEVLRKAEFDVGTYEAAKKVTANYLKSLNNTKVEHESAIRRVLAEYKVATIKELFDLTEKAVADSVELIKKVDVYNLKKAKLQRIEEANNLVIEQIKNIDNVLLPQELEVSKSISNLLVESKAEYDSMKSYYKDKNAVTLLQELQVTEGEYEKLEVQIEANEAEMKKIKAELDEINPRLDALVARTIVVEDGDLSLTYGEVVTKAYSDLLSAICQEIDKTEEAKERAKLRLQGLKKVTRDMEAECDLLRETIIARVASLESAQDTVAELYAEYEKRFEEIGIKTEADLNAIIMDEAELEQAKQKIFDYDEDMAVVRDDIKTLGENLSAHVGYFENYEANLAVLENLRNQEVEAVLSYSGSKAKLEDMEYRYAELVNSNKTLAFIQSKIKGIEDLNSAIKEGALIASDLASLIVERTNAIVKLASKNRYYVQEGADGALVLVLAEKGKARVDKLTKEESVLLPFAMAKAYNEIMVELLAGDTISVKLVSQDKSDKQSASPVYEYSKEREMVIIPEAENAFMNAISKLA